VFTGDEFADGGNQIIQTLGQRNVKASFFLTGRFYRNPSFQSIIRQLSKNGHYLGSHSDQHLLYCDWNKRDSLLVSKVQFQKDLLASYQSMATFGVSKNKATFFLPPYEWYNDSIAIWTKQMGLQLVNYTQGTLSTTDYTTPSMKNYRASNVIYQSIIDFDANNTSGLNGFILLIHIGTDPERTDKFYFQLDSLLKKLQAEGYRFLRIDQLLK